MRDVNFGFERRHYEYQSAAGSVYEVSCNLKGMRISSQDNGGVKLSYLQDNYFPFDEKITIYPLSGKPRQEFNTISTKVTVSVYSNIALILNGLGTRQMFEFNLDKVKFDIDGRTSGRGFCGTDDIRDLINRVLLSALPDQLRQGLNFKFSGFSVFALQNPLFPCNYSIDLKNGLSTGRFGIIWKP